MATDGGGAGAGWSRREFLRAGGLGTLGLGLLDRPTQAAPAGERAVILLLLVGGPSQLDTFDPKPDAPAEVRGPFRSIATATPGVRLCEHLPRLARRLDRVALIRSLHHDEAPIHEVGYQLLQTGRLVRPVDDAPHLGALAAEARGAGRWAVLPGPIGPTGIDIPRGQGPGRLGPAYAPITLDDEPAARDAHGPTEFGRNCRHAARLVESGARMVTVNMARTVFDELSWDAHGRGPFSTLDDYANSLLPDFDRSFAALLDDLDARGLLETTLVVAAGEFGRTPRLNADGGRDHWPGCWSAVVAGGGVPGGLVVGRSDRHAAEPADRPIALAELTDTMAHALGLPADRPVAELLNPSPPSRTPGGRIS